MRTVGVSWLAFQPATANFAQHRHRDGATVLLQDIDDGAIIQFVGRQSRLRRSRLGWLLANWSGIGILNAVDQMQ